MKIQDLYKLSFQHFTAVNWAPKRMFFNLTFLRICVFYTTLLVQSDPTAGNFQFGSNAISSINFAKHPFHYLNTTKASSPVFTDSFEGCALKCVQIPNCVSLNVAASPDDNNRFWCELMASDKYSNSRDFQENASSHHYSIMVSKSVYIVNFLLLQS